MQSDLTSCSMDPNYRTITKGLKHGYAAEDGSECASSLTCRASRHGWIPDEHSVPVCFKEPQLSQAQLASACWQIPPVPAAEWYNATAHEQVRLKYRFGTERRTHCTVPNWRFLLEEPLRLYTFLQHQGVRMSRILVNIGAGDGGMDDPLGPILFKLAERQFGSPWRGTYFEASNDNCVKLRPILVETGNISLRCGYVTPNGAVEAVCSEFQDAPACSKGRWKQKAPRRNKSSSHYSPEQSHRATRRQTVDIDAMNLDIDSYECSVLREVLQVVSPKMIIVETGALVPPPIAFSAEFHPAFQSAEKGVSGEYAISGGSKREGRFVAGCSLSAVVSLLWQHGLGLYRYAMLNAMFVRMDVANEANLMGNDGQRWRPADEFECWRRNCGEHPLGNVFQLTSQGVHSHLLPRVMTIPEIGGAGGQLSHPVSLKVASPPASLEPPWPT